MLGKALRLLALLPVRPAEFWARISALIDIQFDRRRAKPTYAEETLEHAVAEIGRLLAVDAARVLREPALERLESELLRRTEDLRTRAPYPLSASGDFALGRVGYLVCRGLRPAVVIETGVLYGVTSSFILQALAENGTGALHSIDLPPLRERQTSFVGCLIPEGLRGRWSLHPGASRTVMRGLRRKLGRVDVFVHDSLHTYRNMSWEFEEASRAFGDRAVLLSDDVHENAAFLRWSRRPRVRYAAAVRQRGKDGLFGVGIVGP